jgi:hypothetical protein
MHRLIAAAVVVLAGALGASVVCAKTIYIYQDGKRCPLEVPEDYEMYEVECADIRSGNHEVLCGECPLGLAGDGYMGGTISRESGNTASAQLYGKPGDGFFLRDYRAQHLFNAGSWQMAEGGFVDRHNWGVRLDQSTSDLNIDTIGFERSGFVHGLDATNGVTTAARNRRFVDIKLRLGSMDGGTWRLGHRFYETGIGAGVEQAHDVRFWKTSLGTRAVECDWLLDADVYVGRYSSDSALIGNKFSGGSGQARYAFDSDFSLGGDAEVTGIEVGLDNRTVTRSNAAARLEWDGDDGFGASGEIRRVDEANDVVITSHLKGYTDVGGELHYRPNSRLRLGLDVRHREADAERIKLEDPAIFNFYFATPPARADLDAIRVQESASGNFLNFRGRYRFDDAWQLSGNLSQTEWDSLPPAGKFSLGQALEASYFADEHRNSLLRLSRDFCGGGELVFDASDLRRNNSARVATYSSRRYSTAYSAPLWDCQRYSVGLSRTEQSVDLTGATQDWDSSSWDFDLGLMGEAQWASYRFNYTRQMLEGAAGGDYDALTLDLQLSGEPLSFTAWWRQRADGIASQFTGYDDSGIRIGYSLFLDD